MGEIRHALQQVPGLQKYFGGNSEGVEQASLEEILALHEDGRIKLPRDVAESLRFFLEGDKRKRRAQIRAADFGEERIEDLEENLLREGQTLAGVLNAAKKALREVDYDRLERESPRLYRAL